MTREEIKNTPELVEFMLDESVIADSREKLRKRLDKVCNLATKALEQQPCDDMEEIREVMSCDADAETKCKMISNILTAKPHYFKEQEPCEDAISRQAAIAEIEYELEMINSALDSMTLDFNARERLRQRKGEAREILNSIQQLPSVTPQPKWIPVSERLPDDEDYVLVCYEDGHIRTAYYYIDTNIYPSEFEDCCETGWYNYNEDFMYKQDVVAWMPLPEPYKAEIINRNLCDSCTNYGCILQSGIVRNHCDFYITESEK